MKSWAIGADDDQLARAAFEGGTRVAFYSYGEMNSRNRWPTLGTGLFKRVTWDDALDLIAEKMRAANEMIRAYAARDSRLSYVDVFTPMLDASGRPRQELFLEDGLHMNANGYAIWRDLVAPVLR